MRLEVPSNPARAMMQLHAKNAQRPIDVASVEDVQAPVGPSPDSLGVPPEPVVDDVALVPPATSTPSRAAAPRRPRSTARPLRVPDEPPSDDERQARYQRALASARDDEDARAIVTDTYKVPAHLSRHFNRYVAYRQMQGGTGRKFRQQDAVIEMMAWFYADHPLPPDIEDLE